MNTTNWNRYPAIGENPQVLKWLTIQTQLQLSPNTVQAYARALQDFLSFCQQYQIKDETTSQEHIALWVNQMATRTVGHSHKQGLANATMQQRLTAVRLYFDYLIDEQIRVDNPVGRGRYTPGKSFGGSREKGLIPRYQKLPWIPTDAEWQDILSVVRNEPLRTRFMFAMGYDAALRREELCAIRIGDIDPAHRLLHVRAETTKNRQSRVVPYSAATGELFVAYLRHRRTLSHDRDALFLSESRRNYGQPLSIWSWSKVVKRIAQQSHVPPFTTHTLRHLCLTDLARAQWDLHTIAQFAGHRSLQSTLRYIHLSGRELSRQYERTIANLHEVRLRSIVESTV